MSSKLAWGILGTGNIAKKFAQQLAESKTGELVAVGSRTEEAAEAFGDQFNAPRRWAGYQALMDDPDVEAVYISTPHPIHAEWAIKAADAGKHILCEKPLTINYAEAMAVIGAARRNDVFLMEAFMYRCHPQTAKIAELIRDKAIGEVRFIEASFGFDAGFNPDGRLLNNALGGGGILDVGCYAVSISRLIAGAALGKEIAEPMEIKAVGRVGETNVDEYTAALLRFPGDIIAQVTTAIRVGLENVVRIFGSEGNIFVPSPWFCAVPEGMSNILVQRAGKPAEEIVVTTEAGLYTIEADTVAASVKKRQAPSPAMTWDDSLGNMKALDAWRAAIGVTYDSERPETNPTTVHHRPLAPRPGNNMKYGKIEGIEKPISRLVMGILTDPIAFPKAHSFVLFDEFLERGGNCIDTAHIYHGGWSERTIGEWIKSRGVREQIVILDKGAHTPFCNPADMTTQLMESLERLQADYIDIYMLHRDNLEIPVGEFVDALNEHVKAGRIRAFGGSNWTVERLDAANAYAKSKGLAGFAAVSNQFSLADMVVPTWDGCLAASDPDSRAWFQRTQTPLMAWSSTARGFFVRGQADDRTDAELVRCWYSEDNFKRLARAKQLAAKLKVLPIQVAMAYVLGQPFPTFALFGPHTVDEMRISLEASDIELGERDMKWLTLET